MLAEQRKLSPAIKSSQVSEPRGQGSRFETTNSSASAIATNLAVLHTRFFKIDTNTFWQGLSNLVTFSAGGKNNGPGGGHRVGSTPTNSAGISILSRSTSATNIIPPLKLLFATAGVNLDEPGKAVFFNDRLGVVMVRATLGDLDTIEKAVQLVNMSPPQLSIRVKALEVELTPKRTIESLYPRKTLLTNTPGRQHSVTAILNDDEMRDMIREMEKLGGTDLLNCPEVTTLSGRQAQIKVVDVRYIVTDMDVDTNKVSGEKEIRPITEPFELGPVVDVVPYVMPDGYTIQMTVIPSVKEFLGYDDPKNIPDRELWAVGGPAEARVGSHVSPTPLPKFRLRKMATTAQVFDGQTIMLAGGKSRYEQRAKDDGTKSTNYVEKALFFFITPRLIDPAGNPLHSDEEIRDARSRGH